MRIGKTGVRLAADVAASAAPVWVQVATANTYKGYQGGTFEFVFDLPLFQKVIANFRAAPAFHRGANGVGDRDVIAWDFHHASEMPAAQVGANGAPAQGWVQDLDVRIGPADVPQLWALTRWLEPARSYIKEGRYQWASVSITFDAVDPVTGKKLGPVLTSIALTNQPFIEGMQPLAASRFSTGTHTQKGTNVMTTTKQRIFQLAREYRASAVNDAAAIEKAAIEVLPHMNRNQLWSEVVGPLLSESHLSNIRHAVSQGAQLGRAKQPSSTTQTSGNGKPTLDVSLESGPNPLAKILSHVRGRNPGKSHEVCHQIACQLRDSHNVLA